MNLRALTIDDHDFLLQMVVETINWKPGRDADLAEVLADERMARYVTDWGRAGDGGIIAELDNQPVGAVWWRYHTAAEPAYGYVGDDVPEIAIAITAAARGNGVGKKLIAAAKTELARSVKCVSLSVEADNFAQTLYAAQGFVVTERSDNDITMVCTLTP